MDFMQNEAEVKRTALAICPAVKPLLDWYDNSRRTLPWRSEPTAYHVWISEIMLQQTRVAAVRGYYKRFLQALPDVKTLAKVSDDALLKLWQGLGYYNRARNLKRAAQIICEKYDGEFPGSYEDIRALPGIGDYTAGAIASIAFGIAAPAVDGNVLRVLTRFLGDDRDIAAEASKRFFRETLTEAIPKDCPGTFNQALMELGALTCVPNGRPDCEHCPLRENCAAYREDLTDALPVKRIKQPRRVEKRKVYLIFRNNTVLLHRRPDKGLLAGLWEFPNCPEENARPPVALVCEKSGLTAKHVFTHIEWHMESVIGTAEGDTLPPDCVWASAQEMKERYAVPGAFAVFTALSDKLLK